MAKRYFIYAGDAADVHASMVVSSDDDFADRLEAGSTMTEVSRGEYWLYRLRLLDVWRRLRAFASTIQPHT